MSDNDVRKLKVGEATLPEIVLILEQCTNNGTSISSKYVIELIEKAPDQSSAFKYLNQIETICDATLQFHRTDPSEKNQFNDLGNWIKSRILGLR